MPENDIKNLSGVAGTSLITLYLRAMESQRPDALLKDKRAEEVVRQLGEEILRKTLPLTEGTGRIVMILKTRDFDRTTQDFLKRHPDGVVFHLGCGLDSRFERLDDGKVEWYDVDLPEVIALRRKLIGGEDERHHFLACSVLEHAWMDEVAVERQQPVLFLAEGLFMYFEEAQVKGLVLALQSHFPDAELVFDAYSPFLRWSHNQRVRRTKVGSPLHWYLKHAADLEGWGKGIHLLEARYPFQSAEPRLGGAWRARLVPKGIGVFHYHL